MHLAMNAFRLAPSSFWSSAPMMQVCIFSLAVMATAGVAASKRGIRARKAGLHGMDRSPSRLLASARTISRNAPAVSAQRRGDVAAVHRGDAGRGLERQGLREEGLGNVLGGHLAAEQVAAHIVLFGHAARGRACLDECVGEKTRTDAIGIDRVGADPVGAVVERILPGE